MGFGEAFTEMTAEPGPARTVREAGGPPPADSETTGARAGALTSCTWTSTTSTQRGVRHKQSIFREERAQSPPSGVEGTSGHSGGGGRKLAVRRRRTGAVL